MCRAAHGSGRVYRHDLADNKPVEQMADGGEMLLDGRRCEARLGKLLEIGGDMYRLDGGDRRNSDALAPRQKFPDTPSIGARVCALRILAVKNSKKRFCARPPAAAIRAGVWEGLIGMSWFMIVRLSASRFQSPHPPVPL
jgi:hypothetical protein